MDTQSTSIRLCKCVDGFDPDGRGAVHPMSSVSAAGCGSASRGSCRALDGSVAGRPGQPAGRWSDSAAAPGPRRRMPESSRYRRQPRSVESAPRHPPSCPGRSSGRPATPRTARVPRDRRRRPENRVPGRDSPGHPAQRQERENGDRLHRQGPGQPRPQPAATDRRRRTLAPRPGEGGHRGLPPGQFFRMRRRGRQFEHLDDAGPVGAARPAGEQFICFPASDSARS